MSSYAISCSTPKARKPRRCELCLQEIPVGGLYVKQFCRDDDEVYTFKAHVGCNYVAEAYYSSLRGFTDEEVSSYNFEDIVQELTAQQIEAALKGCSEADCERIWTIHRAAEQNQ